MVFSLGFIQALWALLSVDLIKLWKSVGIENAAVGIKTPKNWQACGSLLTKPWSPILEVRLNNTS